MAPLAGALRPRAALSANGLATVAGALAVAAVIYLMVTRLSTERALEGVAIGMGLAVTAYCFLERRVGRVLALLLLYVTLLDGYLKLASGSEVTVLGRDVLLFAAVGGMLVRAIIAGTISVPPLTGLIALYVGICLVQVLHPANTGLLHTVGALRSHIEWVPLFFVAFMYFRQASRLRALFVLLLIVTLINGVVAMIQYQLTPAALAAWGPGYSELYLGGGDLPRRVSFDEGSARERVRPPALGSDVGFGGLLGVLAAPAALALLAQRRNRRSFLTVLTLGGGVLLALFTSQTRVSVLLGVIAALAYVGLSTFSRGRVRVVVGVVVGLMLASVAVQFLASQTGSDVFSRYSSIAPDRVFQTAIGYKSSTFEVTADYVTRYPFGAGLGSVGPAAAFAGGPRPENLTLNGESELNFLLVELGLPGLIYMIGFAVFFIGLAVARIPKVRDDDVRPLLAALGAVLVAIFVGFAGGPTTIGPPTGPFFWLAAGTLTYWLIHLPQVERRARMRHLFASR
jgi:hypothetical protein